MSELAGWKEEVKKSESESEISSLSEERLNFFLFISIEVLDGIKSLKKIEGGLFSSFPFWISSGNKELLDISTISKI